MALAQAFVDEARLGRRAQIGVVRQADARLLEVGLAIRIGCEACAGVNQAIETHRFVEGSGQADEPALGDPPDPGFDRRVLVATFGGQQDLEHTPAAQDDAVFVELAVPQIRIGSKRLARVKAFRAKQFWHARAGRLL
jgi:hypothetical protein